MAGYWKNMSTVTMPTATIPVKQLTQETLLDVTIISYEHNAVGNRTKKTVTVGGIPTTTNYSYNDGNELVTVNGQAYSYDLNGNLTNNGNNTFIYDEENRLIEVKDSANQTIATFTYDHKGKRNSMTTVSGTTYFHYSGDKVVYETDASNNITAEYTYDPLGNPATMTKNGVTYYYHVNGHGDVVALTDGSGNIVAQYSYDAWGNIVSQSGTIASANPLRYAGYRYDDATGLYYLKARYYNPEDGRFITRDTFHGFEEDPLSLNQYAYTKNNPVMYVDPDGHTAALAGIYLIPGIGEIAIAATVIIVGGIIITMGVFWLYSKIVSWVKAYGKNQILQASKNVPSKLKAPDGRVDLSKFNKKKPGSGPPAYLGPLGYYIAKDMAGHGGRVWKLFDWAGKRIASLAGDGKILGK